MKKMKGIRWKIIGILLPDTYEVPVRQQAHVINTAKVPAPITSGVTGDLLFNSRTGDVLKIFTRLSAGLKRSVALESIQALLPSHSQVTRACPQECFSN